MVNGSTLIYTIHLIVQDTEIQYARMSSYLAFLRNTAVAAKILTSDSYTMFYI